MVSVHIATWFGAAKGGGGSLFNGTRAIRMLSWVVVVVVVAGVIRTKIDYNVYVTTKNIFGVDEPNPKTKSGVN